MFSDYSKGLGAPAFFRIFFYGIHHRHFSPVRPVAVFAGAVPRIPVPSQFRDYPKCIGTPTFSRLFLFWELIIPNVRMPPLLSTFSSLAPHISAYFHARVPPLLSTFSSLESHISAFSRSNSKFYLCRVHGPRFSIRRGRPLRPSPLSGALHPGPRRSLHSLVYRLRIAFRLRPIRGSKFQRAETFHSKALRGASRRTAPPLGSVNPFRHHII